MSLKELNDAIGEKIDHVVMTYPLILCLGMIAIFFGTLLLKEILQ